MPDWSSEVVDLARATRSDLGGEGLTIPLARLYSERVRSRNQQRGLVTWDSNEYSARLLDAIELVDAALVGRASGEDPNGALRRAGEILEWLAETEDGASNAQLEPLAAACYQLGGYPARASGVMRGAPAAARQSLLGYLLLGDYAALLPHAATVADQVRERLRRLSRAGSSELEDEDRAWILPGLVTAEVASALGAICAELRWGGEPRAELALSKLKAAGFVLRNLEDPYLWLLTTLIAEIASDSIEKSLRQQVAQLGESLPAGQDVLERYVRQAFDSGRVVAWPSQIRGLDRLSRNDSFALCTPTGSGKTAVAEVALLDGLFREGHEGAITFDDDVALAPLCLYVVPTRALAAEVESKLSRVLRVAGGPRAVTVTGLYGGTDWGPADVWLTNDEPTVLICTQEKAEALVRFFGTNFLARLRLVIIDEAHNVEYAGDRDNLINGDSRALRLESLVTRLRANPASQDARMIALSAVAEQIEDPLAQWISGDPDDRAIRSEYRSTRQLVGRLRCRSEGRFQIDYDRLDGTELRLGSEEDRPYVSQPFPPHPPTEMAGPAKGMAPFALWAAMQFAATGQGRAPGVLISIAQGVRNFANWCIDLLERDWAEVELPEFFTRPEDPEERRLWDQALTICADYFGIDSREYRLLARGVVVHHGKMPGRMPRLFVELLERRIVRMAIATSTLSEGVNLPFETVLIPGLARYGGRPLGGREFGNLVGRAGRPGVATEGQALVLILETGVTPQQRRRAMRDYGTALAAWSSEQHDRGASSALGELVQAVFDEWPGTDPDEFSAWLEETAPVEVDHEDVDDGVRALDSLDAQLLAATVEVEGISGDLGVTEREARLRAVWRSSFAHYASADEARLEDAFVRRGNALHARILPDRETRQRYYRSTLPPRGAAQLFSLVEAFRAQLEKGRDYANWESPDRLEFVLDTVALTGRLDRFKLRDEVGRSKASWRDVLHWWLSPETALDAPSETQVSEWLSFADGDVSYRFSWAIGALLSVLTNETPRSDDPEASAGSPEAWAAVDLPFVALWLKELISWGTLDPVAAYLLARGGAVLRAEAEDRARGYYDDRASGEDQRDLLDPDAVRDWANRGRSSRAPDSPSRVPQRIPVRLTRQIRNRDRRWRVLPVERGSRLVWIDPAGFQVGVSDKPAEWSESAARDNDFVLRPAQRTVVSRGYV